MCGRFVQKTDRERLQQVFNIRKVTADIQPSYNVAPSQKIATLVNEEDVLTLTAHQWGLVPSWSDDPSIGNKMINARAETVREKPSFRDAFKKRRCLIPLDGFYEWKKDGGEKQPFYIYLEDDSPFALAGLWEVNEKMGERLSTCTILTTEANDTMARVHHRMPVILPVEDRDHWLDPDADPEALHNLLRPYVGKDLTLYPVSKEVNSPRNNRPDLLEPVDDQPPLTLFDKIPDQSTPNPA